VHLSIELDREDDGRWIAEALELPGVMTYGETREEAISNTKRLAIEVIADRIKHGELPASALNVSFLVLSEQLAGDQGSARARLSGTHRLASQAADRLPQASGPQRVAGLRVRLSRQR
jgi:predicted RNase H-like HicB family nuclease